MVRNKEIRTNVDSKWRIMKSGRETQIVIGQETYLFLQIMSFVFYVVLCGRLYEYIYNEAIIVYCSNFLTY